MTYVHNSRLRRVRKMQETQEIIDPRRKGTTSTAERRDALKSKVTLPALAIQRKKDTAMS